MSDWKINTEKPVKGIRPSLLTLLLLSVIVVIITSCTGPVKYHVGLVTMGITGKITPPPPESPPTLILVKKYQRMFIETSEGYLYRETISVSQPDSHGNYSVSMNSGTDRVELQFIMPGSNLDSNTFQRTLGVGSMEYDVIPRLNPDWQRSYFLFIKPALSGYITDPAFDITPADQLFIGNWMDSVENSFSH